MQCDGAGARHRRSFREPADTPVSAARMTELPLLQKPCISGSGSLDNFGPTKFKRIIFYQVGEREMVTPDGSL